MIFPDDPWWWPYAFIVLAGVLPTGIWRWIGALAGGGIDEESTLMVLVRCVATALVAAVITQLIFFPGGTLADVALWVRVSALVAGFAAYVLGGQRLWIGIVAGQAVLLSGMFAGF